MTAMSEAYEQMTDTAEQAMDMYDQIAEWCAVLESCAESTDHPYQHQKLTEIAEHLRRLRARQREEGDECAECGTIHDPDGLCELTEQAVDAAQREGDRE